MKKQNGGGVAVSVNLQKFVVGSLVVSTAGSVLFTLCMYAANTSGFSWPYAWNIIGYTITPLLLFAITYVLSRGYKSQLQHWFIAGIKATGIMSAYGALTLAKNGLNIWVMSGTENRMPPMWLSSAIGDYAILAACIAAYLYLELVYKKKKA